MALITITDIYSRIYEEIVDEITREEQSIADQAIEAAQEEAKLYLSRFDLVALFGSDTTEPTVVSKYLKKLCVDIAVWQLIQLGTPNIKYEPAKFSYETAIATLKNIQSGKAQPDGWPYKDTTGQTAPQGNSVYSTGIPKRRNNW